jgi:glutaminase
MRADVNAASRRTPKSRPLASPIDDYLSQLHAKLVSDSGGAVASYIPELKKAKPHWFGIAIATIDGHIYNVGDAERSCTIQSVSKPFLYGYALREYGQEFVLNHVGVEPTGEAFNSIVLDELRNRPFNPMVNAGAMAIAELMKGTTLEQRRNNMLDLLGQFAGRRLKIDDKVYRSEVETGHRNRAIGYMMLNNGMIRRDPAEILELYFQQCSVEVTCRDLAIMAATLANDGVNPLTGEAVLQSKNARDVLTVMNSCGMYNYAGQWAYEVGMPAKSGVSGTIIAVIPGQLGIAVFSPPVDEHGNSVRGVKVCREISEEFGLHVFNNRTNVRSIIRREYSADVVNSNRLRTPEERSVLAKEGGRIAVLELQGALYFGSAERAIRRIATLTRDSDFLIIDFKRVHLADAAAAKLVQHMTPAIADLGRHLVMTHLGVDGPNSELRLKLSEFANRGNIRLFADTDAALEWCEDALLEEKPDRRDKTKFALSNLDIFKGLSGQECRMLERIVQPLHFEKGDMIIREGDPAKLFFVIARGTVSVFLTVGGERKKRVACIGPGLSFGEMALLDGGNRSADVVADERVICYGLSVERVRELAAEHPNIMIVILGNLTRDFSARLRRANEEIRALA